MGHTSKSKGGNVCMSYTTEKAETLMKECYELVKEIRDIEAECLCYIMQHANIGIDVIKKGKRDEERDGLSKKKF
ncbi:unnamed protein product [Prunus armeniaca]|uniref:Uncharacterized protein n=1 Tax=Prunus armeniaca TaxID=36596 RepID=A0A6J5VJ78_PRUAR|nr:unnamed protein product [Prunus armeniaca]